MMGATAIALLLSAPLLLIDLVFVAEVLLGLAPGRRGAPPARTPRIALLVPAHNEAVIVRASVEAMLAAAPPGTRALVVAHNCADATAAEARAGGAEVLVLDEPHRRGKGYALAGGRDALAAGAAGEAPEIVIVIDADCLPERDAFARLAAHAAATGRAVQASYLFRARRRTAPPVLISNFAILVKNLVRQRGGARLGAPALLTGSGMAFPWPLFAGLDLATGNIVEDLALGIALARRGEAPVFAGDATVFSYPSSASGTQTQRARWEGGFLRTGIAHGLPLLARGIAGLRWPLVWLGLHLLTPPLTLLLLLNGAAWLIFFVVALAGGGALGLAIWTAALGAVVGAVLAAWATNARDTLPGTVLARLPLYFLWKLALYARIARGSEAPAWIRTERVD